MTQTAIRATASLSLSLVVGLLAGCSPQSCDPRSGGLIGGVAGTVSGCYSDRVKERQELLDAAIAEEEAANAKAKEAEAAHAAEQARVDALHKEIKALYAEADRLRSEAARIAREDASKRTRAREIEAEIDDVKAKLAALEAGGSTDSVSLCSTVSECEARKRELEARIRALQSELEAIG